MKDFLEAIIAHPWAALYTAILIRLAISGLSDIQVINRHEKTQRNK